MERYCDLHTHSVFSDGTCTPAEIIALAEEMGLSAVALCDHNSVEGLPAFQEAARGSCVEAVGGIELSTEYKGRDLHIVGLYIRPEHYADITAKMEDYNNRKAQSNRALAASLTAAGYELSYEELCAKYPGGNLNRAHFAAALTEKGYTSSIRNAFATLLADDGEHYRPPERFAVMEAIAYLKSIGAAALLAHPFLDLTEDALEEFLPPAKAAGLDGMEVLYSTFSSSERAAAQRIAKKFGLLCSGGSDFHGANKPDIVIGRGRGDLYVPASFLGEIKKIV